MASQHQNPRLRVVASESAQEAIPEHKKLAETPFSGKARLRELEQLAKTARRVREDAERELADSRTSRAIAEQRIATCERTIRRAEEEMAEIRADLYQGEHLDGDESDFKSSEDFELAVLLGKTARREELSEREIADLELSPLPKSEQRRQPQQSRPAPFRSVPRRGQNPNSGPTRRIGFMLLVTAGALLGASITYTALKSPAIQKNVAAIASDPGQLIEEVREAVTKQTIVPTPKNQTHESESPVTATPAPRDAAEAALNTPPPTPEAARAQADTRPERLQQRSVAEQRARVTRQAGAGHEARASNPATVHNAPPAEQAPLKDIASSQESLPDAAQ